MYGDPTAKEGRIGIYGTTGDWHDMSPRLLTSFANTARAGAESVDTTVRTWKPEARPHGGWLERVEITAADGYRNTTRL
ncbi:hypothetical protein ABT024_21395 [Streptomyces sp. NPDC002812]|uniref:hypothetical protein n=1 Tax=Streptomyces sp. NPDC002812 TaxID=3154434 RepID=UPI00332489E9